MIAPERIWAYPSNVAGWNHATAHNRRIANSHEYVRADVVGELVQALEVYADACDATETTACGYEGNMCCKSARAALARYLKNKKVV